MITETTFLAAQAPDDLIAYRNYLRDLWPTLPQASPPTPDNAINILSNRLHQDLRTEDAALQPSDALLNSILKNILISPAIIKTPGGTLNSFYGFGIAAGSIASQGSRSDREYQDYLVSLSGLTIDELSLRFRLNLPRPAGSQSSPVIENILALLGFYRDTFQSRPEPFPIVPPPGTVSVPALTFSTHVPAPFFLEFTEWRGVPFFPENYYQIQPDFDFGHPPGWSQIEGYPPETYPTVNLGDLNKDLAEGRAYFQRGQYTLAGESFANAESQLASIFADKNFRAAKYPPEGIDDFSSRRDFPVNNIDDLLQFNEWFNNTFLNGSFKDEPNRRTQFGLVHLAACVIPVVRGDVALARGDFAEAVRQYLRTFDPPDLVGLGSPGDRSPWAASSPVGSFLVPLMQLRGSLPYTYDSFGGHGLATEWAQPLPDSFILQGFVHPLEKKFFRLRLGQALLEWADSLYRTGDLAALARARELYKAVSWLHGDPPPISPDWSKTASMIPFTAEAGGPESHLLYLPDNENPALASQRTRARIGFLQLEAGLNYFGYADDMIPTLRYRTLKVAADRLAAHAKSAETDFLAFMDRIESLELESLQAANLLSKANLQAQLADQEIALAEVAVAQAIAQRDDVVAAIEAKKKEIEDKESFWSQLGDFASGLVNIAGDVKLAAEAGGGAAMLAGYGAFVVTSYNTLSGMADAANQRAADLKTLQEKTLPAAELQIAVKQRGVTIAGIQKQIAQADAQLAQDLLHFQHQRFMNAQFWAELASVMKRILRRYLDLGARTAWLAERALAYDQDVNLSIVRFDYFPVDRQGVLGADLLASDLEELEQARLSGLQATVPVKYTFSLARDFPLQFGQLKKTGLCLFHTEERPLQWAYPGTYAYRIRAVAPVVATLASATAARGLLSNAGVSTLTRKDGTSHPSVRAGAALPLSELRVSEDMSLYGLPEEALLPFEGSGIDTFWTLELPDMANPYGLGPVADILLTVDMHASYAYELKAAQQAALPKSIERLILVSAQRYAPAALDSLRAPTTADQVTIVFDLTAVGLPKTEKNRRVANLILIVASPTGISLTVQFAPASAATRATVAVTDGVAFSNGGPFAVAGTPASPLNAYLDNSVDQAFTLVFPAASVSAEVRAKIADIVLGIDYTAERG